MWEREIVILCLFLLRESLVKQFLSQYCFVGFFVFTLFVYTRGVATRSEFWPLKLWPLMVVANMFVYTRVLAIRTVATNGCGQYVCVH